MERTARKTVLEEKTTSIECQNSRFMTSRIVTIVSGVEKAEEEVVKKIFPNWSQ